MGLPDKIKKTEASFPAQEPKPVLPCPLAQAAVEPEPEPPAAEVAKVKKTVRRQEEDKPKKSWIEIMLVDMDGKPMPGVRYRITPPGGGEPQEGTLNELGQAGYYQIEPGTCKVTFPDLDADNWE